MTRAEQIKNLPQFDHQTEYHEVFIYDLNEQPKWAELIASKEQSCAYKAVAKMKILNRVYVYVLSGF